MSVTKPAGQTAAIPKKAAFAERRKQKKSTRRELFLVSVLFLVLTGIMTYPWFFHFGTHVLGMPGDNFHYLWKFWWYKHSLIDELSLFNPNASLFFAPNIFYPSGYNLAGTEMTPANIVPFLPLVMLFGEVVSYNIVLLLSFVLSGVGMFLFIKYLTGRASAGILSGVIFAFFPYHMMHSLGHLPLLSIQWLPFMFLYVEKTICEKKTRSALLAGVFYSLLALSSWYYAIILGMALVLFLLFRFEKPFTKLLDKQSLKFVLWFSLPSIVLVVPFMVPYLKLNTTGNMDWQLYAVKGAPPWAFFIPSPLHSLFGHFSAPLLDRNKCENALYVGFTPMLLAAFAYYKRRDMRLVWASAWLILIFFVFSLGPTFSDGTKKIYAIPFGAWGLKKTVITLPGLFLTYLPFMSSIREFTRFGLVVAFFVTTLAGIGFAVLTKSLKVDKKFKILGLATLFILFEFIMIPYPLSKVEGRPVDVWFGQQKGDLVLFAFPNASAFKNPQMYYTTIHGKKIAYGRGTFLPQAFLAQQAVLETLPSSKALAILRSRKVTHIVVDTALIKKEQAQAIDQCSSLSRIKTFSNYAVYELRG